MGTARSDRGVRDLAEAVLGRLRRVDPFSVSDDRAVEMAAQLLRECGRAFFAALAGMASESRRARVLASRLLAALPPARAGESKLVVRAAEHLVAFDESAVQANALLALFAQGPETRLSRRVLQAERSRSPSVTRNLAVLLAHSATRSQAVLEALVGLSRHRRAATRYWATLGLANRATPRSPAALRDALVARVGDRAADVRGEALRGLVRVRHRDAVELVERELRRKRSDTSALRAAALAGDPSLVPALREAARRPHFEVWMRDELEEAISACSGQRSARRA